VSQKASASPLMSALSVDVPAPRRKRTAGKHRSNVLQNLGQIVKLSDVL